MGGQHVEPGCNSTNNSAAGGHGRKQLEHFYANYFIPHLPPDIENVLVSRTVGIDRIVDELILRFTHTSPIDWLLPGVPPTGKRVELALVVVVAFKEGKMHYEHIYWDQASALAQVDLLDPEHLPIVGAAGAHKVQQPLSVPPNGLLKRFVDDPLL